MLFRGLRKMEQPPFDAFRYGLASLLVRRPHLRCHASIAHWWTYELENYAFAIRARDRFRSNADYTLTAEYETLCRDIEDELEGCMTIGENP